MAMRRPPLNRGHSVPTYPNQVTPYDSSLPSLASLSLQDARNSPAGDLMRRGAATTVSEGSRPSTTASSQEGYSPYPSPPLSASSATANGPHSQPHSPSYAPSIPRSRSHSGQPSSSSSYTPPTNPPAISSPPANSSSVLLRNRSTPPHSGVNLKIESSSHEYTLVAPLGGGFSSDSITIAARKGNIIVVVADRWDQEQDCHYEWQVQFDRDADMSSIHATFENGVLKLTVRRITNYIMRS